jgi:adenylate cyclase
MNGTTGLVDELIDSVQRSCNNQLDDSHESKLRQHFTRLLQKQPDPAQPKSCQITILISDLHSFSSITAQMPARQVIEMLNLYFSQMCEIIYRHGGTIDKFMGDTIMVLFGLQQSHPDDLQQAIACAVEMQQAMDRINRDNRLLGFPRLYMGIGINSGKVMAGNLGSELYSEYTVIGDAVNLASRIEAYSLRGQILLSQASQRQAADYIETGEVNRVHVKGKREPVTLYELLATSRPKPLQVPRVEARRTPRIPSDLPLSFRRLQGKWLEEHSHQGRVVDLSYNGMLASTPIQLERLSEIKINLSLSLMNRETGTIYAKVLRSEQRGKAWHSRMEFSYIDDDGQAALKNHIDQSINQR